MLRTKFRARKLPSAGRTLRRQIDARHDEPPVLIDEVDLDLVRTLFDPAEDHAQGDGTLRVDAGNCWVTIVSNVPARSACRDNPSPHRTNTAT